MESPFSALIYTRRNDACASLATSATEPPSQMSTTLLLRPPNLLSGQPSCRVSPAAPNRSFDVLDQVASIIDEGYVNSDENGMNGRPTLKFEHEEWQHVDGGDKTGDVLLPTLCSYSSLYEPRPIASVTKNSSFKIVSNVSVTDDPSLSSQLLAAVGSSSNVVTAKGNTVALDEDIMTDFINLVRSCDPEDKEIAPYGGRNCNHANTKKRSFASLKTAEGSNIAQAAGDPNLGLTTTTMTGAAVEGEYSSATSVTPSNEVENAIIGEPFFHREKRSKHQKDDCIGEEVDPFFCDNDLNRLTSGESTGGDVSGSLCAFDSSVVAPEEDQSEKNAVKEMKNIHSEGENDNEENTSERSPAITTQALPHGSNREYRHRFRHYQEEQWLDRFQDLLDYKQQHGHCNVPNIFAPNPPLAQWVKRQRYQYKLLKEGRHSTLTQDRQDSLNNIGFVWDSHHSNWMERWYELASFVRDHGHANVPTNYGPNRQLSIWVKCQRRQYKLFLRDQQEEKGITPINNSKVTRRYPSHMTPARIEMMESLGFIWNPRGLKKWEEENDDA